MEQKKSKMTGRDLHAGDIVRFNNELHQIGTIGRIDAFAESTMAIIHLADAEPVALTDAEALKSVGVRYTGSKATIKGDGVSAEFHILGDDSVHLVINTGTGPHTEYLNKNRAFLHVVQQLAWKHGHGELKLRVPKSKNVKK